MTTPEIETLSPASGLKPKTKLTGKVVKTTLAGALLDIGKDIPGIVHISQMSESPVKRVEDVLQIGQEVPVWVRKVKADRVELTMIEPLGVDWRELKPEMVFKGKVIRLETYGAFVEIGAERPGLVHISEMAHGYVKTPGDVVKEGDEIEVMVLDIDRKKKQIRLSMKAVQPPPEEKEERVEAPRPERSQRGERGERKRGGKKAGGRQSRAEKIETFSDTLSEIEPTAFELAWKQALERSKAEKAAKAKKIKTAYDQEDLLSRTLKNRLPTA